MASSTAGMNAEEIIALGKTRSGLPWQWGIFADRPELRKSAADLGVTLHFGEPVRPGDTYLAQRNTGPKLLTCNYLAEACVYATTPAYPYDFSECVLVK